jgi:predicted amidohydrolase YtcJ
VAERLPPFFVTATHRADLGKLPQSCRKTLVMNRKSAVSAVVFGPDLRAPPYLALRAVTAYAAYQIKEEKTKGTLEAGKLADLVVLADNPLKVDSSTIKNIAVMETIKEGKTVYLRD